MGRFSDLSHEAEWRSKGTSGSKQLENTEHHKPMTVEEIAHELARATVYTKADALKAFLQIHLTHKVSLLTMFNSHRGWLRFLRMSFGA